MTTHTRIKLVPEASASSVILWPILGRAAAAGLSSKDLLADFGLVQEEVVQPGARVPLRAAQRMCAGIAERLGEPQLGISALGELRARSATSWPDPISLYEHLFRSSATLGEGVHRLSRYTRILRDGFQLLCHDGDGVHAVRLDFPAEDPFALVQLQLAMSLMLQRRVLPDVPCVEAIWFHEPRPDNTQVYEDYFQLPVRFGAPFNGLVSERSWWDEPLPEADATRCARVQWRADTLLRALPRLDRTSERVMEAVRDALPAGDVRAQAIAKRLSLSPRTLHRRLQGEGETYQGVLDRARCAVAKRELVAGDLPVRDVGLRVGFSNSSAFHRAFKAWTGLTPLEYREQQAERSGGDASVLG